MGLLGKIADNFKASDMDITSRMSVQGLQKSFKQNFNLTLRVYNGVKFADPKKKLASFKKVDTSKDSVKIKASNKIGATEKLFEKHFGLKVQIADKKDKELLPNDVSLGEAARGNYNSKK